MISSRTLARTATAAASLALLATAALAQNQPYNTAASSRDSGLPYLKGGYIGGSLGRSKYDLSNNGTGPFGSDDHDTAAKIYGGGMFNQNFGLELGYIHFGEIDRAGGSTRAQGLNLSLVGKAPLGDRFDVFGKLGTTYGWTRTSTAVASGLPGGKENGFGVSYGVGGSYYFTPQLAGVLEWESHDLKFAGTGRDQIKAVTVGLRYNY
jgi:OOP family OmpA-OmpF porin